MLALKIIGAALCCLCGFFAGRKKVQNLKLRADTLSLMSSFLSDVRRDIKYKRDSAMKMLCDISADDKYNELKLKLYISSVPYWPQARKEALESLCAEFNGIIPENELQCFCEAVGSVGEYCAEEEETALEYYIIKLSEFAENAYEAVTKNKKLYTGVGAFAGAAIAIILL